MEKYTLVKQYVNLTSKLVKKSVTDSCNNGDCCSPAQYLWTSGICCCWPDCLELFARGHAGSGGFWGQLYRQSL